MNAGADGVFLINHRTTRAQLFAARRAVLEAIDGTWVGLNVLGLHPEKLFSALPLHLAGLWVDNALITEQDEQPDAESVRDAQNRHGWASPQLYFGGVAFKYQPEVMDVARVAQTAARYVDVVTTSGPATGQAAAPEKIRLMKETIGDVPLAIASGITPENVRDYLPIADAFLVSTGISSSFAELDEVRTRALVDRVRDYSTASD